MPSRSYSLDVSTWSRERFAALLAVLLLACSWMAASGARAHATLRQAHYRNLALWHSKSPVPYLAPVTSTRHLPAVTRSGEPPLVLVRADSAVEAATLCALAENAGRSTPRIAWIALSSAVEPCVEGAGRPVLPFLGAAADTPRIEMKDARWVMLDGNSRVLYSSRSMPTAGELREIATVLTSPHTTGPGR